MKTNQPMFAGRVVVLGGIFLAGKDTNALWLTNKFPEYLTHQTTSGLLRQYPESVALMQRGAMVPSPVVYRAVSSYLNTLGQPTGLLANGWVRAVGQGVCIHRLLQRAGYTDIRFVEFQVEDNQVLEARRQERWHALRRPDDEYKVAWRRIRAYRERSEAILRACKLAGFDVRTVDASGPLAVVQQKFARAVVS